MRYMLTKLRIGAALAFVLAAGCATMKPRSSVEISRASLAVLCTDADLDLPAKWCGEPEPNRPWLPASSAGR